jgi:signal transduction histidine kinase
LGVRLPVERIKRIGLRGSFFLLALCGLAVSLVLLALLWQGCGAIAARYSNGGYIIGPGGLVERLPSPSPEEARLLELLGDIKLAGCIILPLLGLAGAGALFYRWKLKRPIALLMEGTRRIQAQDLDFSIPQPSRDELGQLCAAFETMRAQLLRTNRELWRQGEERKRLNAAFAHDLRNPVTVLKGSVTLLRQGSRDPQLLDRLERYTQRIAEYVEAMGGVQRLEQLPVRPAPIDSAVLAAELAETARLLAPRLTASLSAPAPGPVALDHGILLTVAENLIGNAARFGRERLEIALSREGDTLTLTVADDGPGFPPELLRDGPKPFGRLAEDPEHFGMGLYSSRLLCQKHGGELRLQNRPAGGAAAVASLRISPGP